MHIIISNCEDETFFPVQIFSKASLSCLFLAMGKYGNNGWMGVDDLLDDDYYEQTNFEGYVIPVSGGEGRYEGIRRAVR